MNVKDVTNVTKIKKVKTFQHLRFLPGVAVILVLGRLGLDHQRHDRVDGHLHPACGWSSARLVQLRAVSVMQLVGQPAAVDYHGRRLELALEAVWVGSYLRLVDGRQRRWLHH